MELLQSLFQKYLDNTISEEEYAEMWHLLSKENEADGLTPQLQQLWEQQPQHSLSPTRWNSQFKALKEIQQPVKGKIVHLYRKVAVAACLAILLGIGSYYFVSYHKNGIKKYASETVLHDITPPITSKATLTLGNGKLIVLDSAGIGSLASEGVANASKVNDAKLMFTANTAAVEYHTLQVPKGSKPMQLQLADGSQVWLNTASSITFPNIFTGNERNVTITGEAYFEVAHNAAHPFIVKVNDMQVEVLGTHFNINAYSDESAVKTTLLEGSVKIINNRNNKILLPAQQAQLNKSGTLKIINHVDINEVMAWKEGNFLFENDDIYEVMKQLQRWYDVEVEYQTQNIHQHFEGVISRNVSLSKVLEMLERSSNIKFIINDKKVIIK
ncbi:MAG: DUF4974 domain-containing protein [Chitinophagaceae bacterium]|jgi:phosphatidylserine decarboxylase|nr:DUF4974 domain-containing protein [Chitinophagaceae bacterium]